jgi:hypothetical protein
MRESGQSSSKWTIDASLLHQNCDHRIDLRVRQELGVDERLCNEQRAHGRDGIDPKATIVADGNLKRKLAAKSMQHEAIFAQQVRGVRERAREHQSASEHTKAVGTIALGDAHELGRQMLARHGDSCINHIASFETRSILLCDAFKRQNWKRCGVRCAHINIENFSNLNS